MTFVNGTFQAPQMPGTPAPGQYQNGSTPAPGALFMQNDGSTTSSGPSSINARLATVSSLLGLDNDVLSDPSLQIKMRESQPLSPDEIRLSRKVGEKVRQVGSAEMSTPIDVINNYMTQPKEDRTKLQMKLYNAHLYPPDYYNPQSNKRPNFGSTMDDGALNALETVLRTAALTGQSFDSIVQQETATAQAAGLEGGNANVTKLSNPVDLRATFQAAARATLGRNADEAAIDRMVASYQSLESQESNQSNNLATQGGTYTTAPSAQEFATDQLQQQDPQGAAQYGYLQRFNEFRDLLNSSSGLTSSNG